MADRHTLSANDWLFRALLAVIVLAPLPLAANRPWAWSLLCLLVGALCLGWGWLALSGRARPGMDFKRLLPVAIPVVAALAWAFIQSLPFVPGPLAHPIWAEAAAALPPPAPLPTISPDPELTRVAIMRTLAYGAVFLLAAQLGRNRERARLGLRVLAWTVLAYCAYGLAMNVLEIERVLWLKKWAYVGDATGTFVSRNAFGSLAGVG
ncbi:MAG TPA: O-antigen ligase domain-containing protein, partial [Magnetospirillum sp.]|nr:O-antigen ligase domain-containing protein [Magnetospirillum sp.]